MHSTRRTLTTLASVGAVAVILATPSPAQAKSDYRVTISGKQAKAGDTVTVTVALGDDAGITRDARMCLFQIVGDRAPVPHSTYGYPDYAIPAGSRYVKVADCQRPAPDAEWAGMPQYESGTTTYKLKVTSNGWLALAAFREENHVRMNTGGPILSNIVFVSGPGSIEPGAAAAKAAVVSISPAHEPETPPSSPPSNRSGQARPSTSSPVAAASPGDVATEPSRLTTADTQGARKARRRPVWLAVAVAGSLLLGGLTMAVTKTVRSRSRFQKP